MSGATAIPDYYEELSIEDHRALTGVDDLWGIINWARDADCAVWDACPGARFYMLQSAAVRRWEAHYQHRSGVVPWLRLAVWIARNFETIDAS